MQEFIVVLIAIANFYALLHFGFYLVGANFYDILRLQRLAEQRWLPKRRSQRARKYPLVSVVIPAYNEEVNIWSTLDSVCNSTYRNIEIVVVNDGSTDETTQIVSQYIRQMPNRPAEQRRSCRSIVLVEQDNVGKAAAMNNGICNYARGKFVMCLDGDAQIHPQAIEHALEHFKDKKVVGVAANVRIKRDMSWLGLLQQFEHVIGYRSKKFYSMTGSEFVVGGVASTYRMSTLRKVGFYDTDSVTEDIALSLKIIAKEGNRQKRIIYGSDVIAYTEGVHNYGQLLRQWYRWKMGMLQCLYKYRHLLFNFNGKKYSRFLTLYRLPIAILGECFLLLVPVMFGYIVYASIVYHRIDIILGAYTTITLYTLCNLWPDEHFTRKQKFYMTLQGFFIYITFYTMDIVQLVAVYRCIKNYKQVVRGAQGHTTWTPPTRKGEVSLPQ